MTLPPPHPDSVRYRSGTLAEWRAGLDVPPPGPRPVADLWFHGGPWIDGDLVLPAHPHTPGGVWDKWCYVHVMNDAHSACVWAVGRFEDAWLYEVEPVGTFTHNPWAISKPDDPPDGLTGRCLSARIVNRVPARPALDAILRALHLLVPDAEPPA